MLMFVCTFFSVEGEGIHLVPDRFRSRWFGGWTGKVCDAFHHSWLLSTTSYPHHGS